MNKLFFLALASAGAMLTAVPGMAQNYDVQAYKGMVQKADNDYKVSRAQCSADTGNAKTVCIEQAKAARAHSQADAVTQYKNTDKNIEKAKISVADADYDVARAKCGDMSGSDKASCISDAKAAKADAIGSAETAFRSASANETSADCDRMSGTDKAGCLTRTNTAAAGEAVADSVITTKVKADLIKEPDLKSMNVHVETVNGVVNLSGFVPSSAEADRAVQVARVVKGVTEVQNNLKVSNTSQNNSQ